MKAFSMRSTRWLLRFWDDRYEFAQHPVNDLWHDVDQWVNTVVR